MLYTTNWGLMRPETAEGDLAIDWGVNLKIIDEAMLSPVEKLDLLGVGADKDIADTYHVHDDHNDVRYSPIVHDHNGVHALETHSHSADDITSGVFAVSRIPAGIGADKVAQVRTGAWTIGSSDLSFASGWQNITEVGGGVGYFALGSVNSGSMLMMGATLRANSSVPISLGACITHSNSTPSSNVLRQFTHAYGNDSAGAPFFYQFPSGYTGVRLYIRVFSQNGCTLRATGGITGEKYCNAGYTLFTA